ncbi:hypothetical protein ACLKA7_013516 [Drosophila subpalustris]
MRSEASGKWKMSVSCRCRVLPTLPPLPRFSGSVLGVTRGRQCLSVRLPICLSGCHQMALVEKAEDRLGDQTRAESMPRKILCVAALLVATLNSQCPTSDVRWPLTEVALVRNRRSTLQMLLCRLLACLTVLYSVPCAAHVANIGDAWPQKQQQQQQQQIIEMSLEARAARGFDSQAEPQNAFNFSN